MNRMQEDLLALGQQLWPTDDALRPATVSVVRRRRRLRSVLLVVALGGGTLVLLAGVLTVGLVLSHQRGGTTPAKRTATSVSPASSGQPTASPSFARGFTQFSDRSLSFVYPAAWSGEKSSAFGSPSYGVLVLLSSQHLLSDCRSSGPLSFQCAPTMAINGHLSPGNIFVYWAAGFVGSNGLAGTAGQATTIAGHQARIDSDPQLPACRATGADHAIEVSILGQEPTTAYIMTACWQSTTSDTFAHQIDALLASIRIAPGA
jgi:hypothetical protein